jgi:hypothetical protein
LKESIFNYIVFTYPFAILLIVFGYTHLKKTIKEEHSNYNYLRVSSFINGVIFSIGCVAFGIFIIIFKLNGKI